MAHDLDRVAILRVNPSQVRVGGIRDSARVRPHPAVGDEVGHVRLRNAPAPEDHARPFRDESGGIRPHAFAAGVEQGRELLLDGNVEPDAIRGGDPRKTKREPKKAVLLQASRDGVPVGRHRVFSGGGGARARCHASRAARQRPGPSVTFRVKRDGGGQNLFAVRVNPHGQAVRPDLVAATDACQDRTMRLDRRESRQQPILFSEIVSLPVVLLHREPFFKKHVRRLARKKERRHVLAVSKRATERQGRANQFQLAAPAFDRESVQTHLALCGGSDIPAAARRHAPGERLPRKTLRIVCEIRHKRIERRIPCQRSGETRLALRERFHFCLGEGSPVERPIGNLETVLSAAEHEAAQFLRVEFNRQVHFAPLLAVQEIGELSRLDVEGKGGVLSNGRTRQELVDRRAREIVREEERGVRGRHLLRAGHLLKAEIPGLPILARKESPPSVRDGVKSLDPHRDVAGNGDPHIRKAQRFLAALRVKHQVRSRRYDMRLRQESRDHRRNHPRHNTPLTYHHHSSPFTHHSSPVTCHSPHAPRRRTPACRPRATCRRVGCRRIDRRPASGRRPSATRSRAFP